jgi:uncharacterized Zn finger protein
MSKEIIKENINCNINCNNCGKFGHAYHQCKYPITSVGLIVYTKIDNMFYYLMIRLINIVIHFL